MVDLIAQRRALRLRAGLILRDEHAILELLTLARIEALLAGYAGVVIRELALAVLAVQQLGGDHNGGRCIQQLDLQGLQRQVALLEAHHALGSHAHMLAAWSAPDQAAAQHALAEVQAAVIFHHLRVAQAQRLVVDVQSHGLGIWNRDDALPCARQAVGILCVLDVPGLMHAVDERAVGVGISALFRVATQAQVAVGQRKEGFGNTKIHGVRAGLDQRPLVDRVVVTIHGLQRIHRGVLHVGTESLRTQVTAVNRALVPRLRSLAAGCEEVLQPLVFRAALGLSLRVDSHSASGFSV